MMPTPVAPHELPPSADQLPPNSQNLETPQVPTPANQPTPMNQTQPMPMPTPMPTPAGPEATQMSYPQIIPRTPVPAGVPTAGMVPHGAMPPGAIMQDSRQHQPIMPVRL